MGFANEKGWNKQIFLGYFSNGEGVDFVDTLRYKIFSCIPFSLAETGFEPALPTSKSGRPLSLSAFSLRNSRFLACITFLLLPPAAVGAAAPGTRRSQGIKKDTRFFSCIPFSLAETGFEPATSGL